MGATHTLCVTEAFTSKGIQPSFVIYNDLSPSYGATVLAILCLINLMVAGVCNPQQLLCSACVGALYAGDVPFSHLNSLFLTCQSATNLVSRAPINVVIHRLACACCVYFNALVDDCFYLEELIFRLRLFGCCHIIIIT